MNFKNNLTTFLAVIITLSTYTTGICKSIQLKIEQPIIPVLVKKEASAVIKLNFVRTQPKNYIIQHFHFDLAGTTDINDITSLQLYGVNSKGFVDLDNPLTQRVITSKEIILNEEIAVNSDTFSLWVTVNLKEKVALDHLVAVNCRRVRTSLGNLSIPKMGEKPLKVGVAVRQKKQDGVISCRIPGLATSKKGTLLAIFDARYDSPRDLQGHMDIGLHRSTDKGVSWEPLQIVLDMGTWGGLPQKFNGVSDACILVDKNSDHIYVAGLWMHGALDNNGKWIEGLDETNKYWIHQWQKKGSQPGTGVRETCQFLIARSADDGLTWGFPFNITEKTKLPEWWLFAPAPGQGITLQDGTLVFPTQGRDDKGKAFSNITYSKDGGKTWITSHAAYSDVTECNAVQLNNGDVMLNMRDNRNRGNVSENGRRICTTSDLGKTWTEHATSRKALIEPTCMASLHKHEFVENGKKKSILFFSNPSNQETRTHLTLKISFDDGESWPKNNWILFDQYRSAGYSSITSVDENTIGVLYESSQADLVYLQFKLDEIIKK